MSQSAEMAQESPYEVSAVARACDLMRVLSDESGLKLHEIAERACLSRPTAFRLLATLQKHGVVLKDNSSRYRMASHRPRGYRYLIGYASQTDEFAFSREVTYGIIESAKLADVDLIVLNNDYSASVALTNADQLLKERIDLMIEFQTDVEVASLISERARKRHVPLIAIEIPHPSATYFGVNNCQAGLAAGRQLGRWASQHWKGRVDEMLLLGLPQAGSLPEGRLVGSVLGLREVLPDLQNLKIVPLNGNGCLALSQEIIARHLQTTSARRFLVSAINDPSAMGALAAFRDAGRLEECAVMGQSGSVESRVEMRTAGTRMVGSIGYFPERYGEQLIPLAQQMLNGGTRIPRAVFVKHQLLTPSNIRQYYKREMKPKVAPVPA